MAAPTGSANPRSSANPLPSQTPNTSSPIAQIDHELMAGELFDGLGKPVTGTLKLSALVTTAWRYLFGTFIQRSASVNSSFSLTADGAYSQSQMQALIAQVEAISKVIGPQQ